MDNRKILNDICSQIQEAIGDKPLQYKITYDMETNLFTVKNTVIDESVSKYRTYHAAVLAVAQSILQDAEREINLKRG